MGNSLNTNYLNDIKRLANKNISIKDTDFVQLNTYEQLIFHYISIFAIIEEKSDNN